MAPLVFAALVLGGISGTSDAELSTAARDAKLDDLAGQLVSPYIGMAIVATILAVAMTFAPLPNIEDE